MADPIETKQLDKRVAHRYVRKGLLEDKEWEKHIKNLPDLAAQAVPLEASMEGDDLDDDEPEPPAPGTGPVAIA
jgi:hypothetical protein